MEDLPPNAITSPGVINELRKYADPRLRYWGEFLSVASPSPKALETVRIAAEGSGDDARLSPVDMEVLALALDLKATLLTDDYSIQNLACVLGVKYQGVGFREIKKVIIWKYRCKGCGKVFDKNQQDCPICGSELRSTRSRG